MVIFKNGPAEMTFKNVTWEKICGYKNGHGLDVGWLTNRNVHNPPFDIPAKLLYFHTVFAMYIHTELFLRNISCLIQNLLCKSISIYNKSTVTVLLFFTEHSMTEI